MLEDGGIDATDSEALDRRRPWARIGETRTYVFERRGAPVRLLLTFTGMPPKEIALSLARAGVGLSFLLAGVLTHMKLRRKSTGLLALVGISAASMLNVEPFFQSATPDRLYWACQAIVAIFGFVFFSHFMSLFPDESPWAGKVVPLTLLYGPAVLLALTAVFTEMIPVIPFEGPLRAAVSILLAAFLVAQFILIPYLMIRNYVRAAPERRRSLGLHAMLIGTVAGLAPVFLLAVLALAAPGWWLPGTEYYALSLIVVPITFTLACLRRYRSSRVPAC